MMKNNSLKIISLGGFGNVTKNMFVYETQKDILIVDCGVGFPEEEMMGVDLVIPDTSYLQNKKGKIKAIILTHGHDDHIGGLPYIINSLPKNLPIFGPRWAIALARQKLEEFGIFAKLVEYNQDTILKFNDFSLEFVKVTHSIPDTYHIVLKSPVGVIYHAADYKLDLVPIIGEPADKKRISQIGKNGVLCLLSDCLRAEVPGFTPPEAKLEEMFEEEISRCEGKFIITTMSSNISRLKQAIDVSLRHKRMIVPIGMSIEKNLELARKLKLLNYSRDIFLRKKQIKKYPPHLLTLLVAGSQGQSGSALERIVSGEVPEVKIGPKDKVIFSTDYIPGNERAIYNLIDNIYRLGAEVVYQDIHDNVHVSGHGSQEDLGKLMEMVRPKYLVPIGGNFRHMIAFKKLAIKKGFRENQVILPDDGDVLEFFFNGDFKISKKIQVKQIMVDALGVGDVKSVVLRDRKILSEEGIVVVVLPVNSANYSLEGSPEIVTRGFIYIKENKRFLKETKDKIRKIFKSFIKRKVDYYFIRRKIQEELENFFFEITGRQPMVLVVIIEV